MTNEAVMIQQLEDRLFEVEVPVSGVWLKGATLGLFDAQIGSNTTSGNHFFAGIATADKTSTDGINKASVWRAGVFDMKTSGTAAIVAGQQVGLSTLPNAVAIIPDIIAASGGRVVGVALQDGQVDETIQVRLTR